MKDSNLWIAMAALLTLLGPTSSDNDISTDPRTQDGSIDPGVLEEVTRSAWKDTINAAERFNEPGRFTTFEQGELG